MKDFLFSLWFLLPIGLANMVPVFFIKIPFLKKWTYPLDFYQKYHGKKILGAQKTIRGLLGGILIAIVAVKIQQYLYVHNYFVQSFSLVNYAKIHPLILGFLAGFGALGGDSAKSFFKRQVGIPSGKSWFPFDQMDFLLGAIITTYFYVHVSLVVYIYVLIEGFLLHMATAYTGYLLRLKKDPI